MKTNIFKIALVAICCFMFATISLAQSTSCTLTISGPSGHGYTYDVYFYVWDYWNSPPIIYAGPSTPPVTVYIGTNYNVEIKLGVVPDCYKRWVVQAHVRQYYYGILIASRDDYSGLLSSDEYYDPTNLIFSVTF